LLSKTTLLTFLKRKIRKIKYFFRIYWHCWIVVIRYF
jgi:hypothetical protein